MALDTILPKRPEKLAPPRRDPELLTVSDVARILGVTRQTVYKLMLDGQIRFVRVGRGVRFRREWVDEFIDTSGRPGARRSRRRS